MATYVAHYKSPNGVNPVSGVFEFESTHNAGSKQNMHDARMCMLTAYGSQAVSWQIDSIEKKSAKDTRSDHQMELDFREPIEPPKRKKRSFDRGISSRGIAKAAKAEAKAAKAEAAAKRAANAAREDDSDSSFTLFSEEY